MKFGQVENPAEIDFTLAPTATQTWRVLAASASPSFEAYVGCASWSRAVLSGFYPRGTKDELSYYATQFNSIELNATFYRSPSPEQVLTWKNKTLGDFKFFPKIPQSISHYSRLLGTREKVAAFTDAISFFEEKLGMCFLQLHDNYKPKDFDRLAEFIAHFPAGIPLALEVRNESWFVDSRIAERLYTLLEQYGVTNVLVDTAGRRELLHMRLTTAVAFIRFVGTNHPSDYQRLEEWVELLSRWKEAGLQKLYFFIHQDIALGDPLLATHFIEQMNAKLKINVRKPLKNTNSKQYTASHKGRNPGPNNLF